MYSYTEAIREDVREAIKDRYTEDEIKELDFDDVYDDLWTDDGVTGNASGSYTCNSSKAREYLMEDPDTEDFVKELISEWCIEPKTIAEHLFDWEYWDVSIRCYLLGGAVQDVLDELQEEE